MNSQQQQQQPSRLHHISSFGSTAAPTLISDPRSASQSAPPPLLVTPASGTSSSASAAIPLKAPANARPLDRFVLLQTAAGNFALSAEFASQIGISYDTLVTEIRSCQILKGEAELPSSALFEHSNCFEKDFPVSVRESLLGTALAIAFLSARFPESKNEWSLLSAKARKWLQREAKKVTVKKFTQTKSSELLTLSSRFYRMQI